MALLTKYLKHFKASQSEEREEGGVQLVKTQTESFVFLDMGKESLNAVACFIALFIPNTGTNGPFTSGNDRYFSLFGYEMAH